MGAISKTGTVAIVAMALLAFGCASASATTRYAAPGGTAADTGCSNPAPGSPRCTIYTAAKGPNVLSGDEVVVEPGNYSDADMSATGDLGPTGAIASPAVAGNIHGAIGQPLPVITLNNAGGAVFATGGTIAHLAINNTARSIPLYISSPSSVADGVVVRSSVASGTACYIIFGILRNSACLATGAGARAVGGDGGGTTAQTVRSVTAISSGTGATVGVGFSSPAASTTVTVKSTIARAPNGFDIKASESGGGNASIAIDHSNFVTTSDQGGDSPITQGAGNQTALPALAADGYHQLPTSTSTVNLGVTDGSSGAADIDGQFRTIDGTDIGADELAHSTTTSLTCTPTSLVLSSGATSCHVLVTDTAAMPGGPAGTVTFATSGPGAFAAPSCVLEPVGIGFMQGECTVAYTPSAVGSGTHMLGGSYAPEDQLHEKSTGSTPLTVKPVPTSGPKPGKALSKKCKKHRKRKHGKCVKKKKKKKKHHHKKK